MTWTPPPPIVALEERVRSLMLDGKTAQADRLMAAACLDKPYGLYILLRYGCGRLDAANQWVFDRCAEVQANPNGHLDLWAREHYKSTIITFAKTIQDVLANPELTVGIFSHTRPIAKGFLRQIKLEFERNERLKRWFPDVLYAEPQKESPKWSEDEGIVVKRSGNPKESTIEAWGLVDGQPTSKHYQLRVYDDVVTRESVTSPEMMHKTTQAWELSDNLGTTDGIERYIGTRYHSNDTYKTMMDRKAVKTRIHAATVDGTVDGEPVFLTREKLAEKRSKQGPYTFGCQMLLNPTADEAQGFKQEWLRYASVTRRGHNLVILVDPSSGKKNKAKDKQIGDFTSMWCLGLGADRKVYVHDMLRDRINLTERGRILMAWHRLYQPMAVGYEEYGMQADIEHIQSVMEDENYRFDITPLGGIRNKQDRIRRLIPWFENGRLLLNPTIQKTNYEGRLQDLTAVFRDEEYLSFPVSQHDDMLDALSRFCDEELPIRFPLALYEEDDEAELEMAGANPVTGY